MLFVICELAEGCSAQTHVAVYREGCIAGEEEGVELLAARGADPHAGRLRDAGRGAGGAAPSDGHADGGTPAAARTGIDVTCKMLRWGACVPMVAAIVIGAAHQGAGRHNAL